MNGLWAIIVFGILVIVHEFGHFVAARLKGVRVEKFALGFGPAIFKRKVKDTLLLICVFPLGGYVKMAGDERNQCSGAEGEFFSKSAGARAQIVFAGPLFNYLLAFVLFCFFAFLGFPSSQCVVGKIIEGFPAETAGIEVGDRILAVNGAQVSRWSQMQDIISKSKEKVSLTIERAGAILEVTSAVKSGELPDDLGRPQEVSLIGVVPEIIKYNFLGSVVQGAKTLSLYTSRFFKGLAAMIFGIVPFQKAAMGPLGIYFLTSEIAKSGVLALLHLVAILSLSLGLINLFPIPVLDGGHILFFLIEKIRKKQLTQQTEGLLNRIGIAIIGLLLIFVFYNDIKRGPHIFDDDEKTAINEEQDWKE